MDKKRPKDKAGRPTLFKQEYTEKLIQYFNVDPYVESIKTIVTKTGNKITIPIEIANDFPSLAGFAISIGVHRDTMHEWSKATDEKGNLRFPEFSDAYKRAKDYQENYLLINANKGLISAPVSIFTMKNVLGYRDKQPDEVDVIINNADTAQQLKEMAEELKRIAKKPNE